MYKIVFMDIDNTLYSHKTNRIPPSALEAVELMQKHGIKVFGCTGRHRIELTGMGLDAFQPDGWVLLNGAMSSDKDGILCADAMHREDLDVLKAEVRRKPFPLLVMTKDQVYLVAKHWFVYKILIRMNKRFIWKKSMDDIANEEILMFVPVLFHKKLARILSGMPHTVCVRWTPYVADCYDKNAGKGVGIARVLEKYGIRKEEAAAFGDADNDLSMFEAVGQAVCMGNGNANAKAAADYITSDIDEDGILNGVRHLFPELFAK